MINVSETIKKLRKEYSLTQEQFGRAVGCEGSTVSKWESGDRIPDISTLGHIANTFGYDIEFTLKEKVGHKKDKDFYKEKTYNEILNMSIDDLADYIFVTQDEFVTSNICKIHIDTLEYIPLENLKLLIKDNISHLNRLALYFKINKEYLHMELEMAYFIEHVKYHLENLSNIDKNILPSIEYISLTTDYFSEGYREFEYYYFTDIKLLDKDMNVLDISKADIDGNQVPLDDSIDLELGDYLMNDDEFEIKLNY